MPRKLLHEFIAASAAKGPDRVALLSETERLNYGDLMSQVVAVGNGLIRLGVSRRDRVAIFLPKRIETVVGMFATSFAGGVFVPVNPVLKPPQVAHILRDSGARVLLTSAGRAETLEAELATCAELRSIVLVEADRCSASPGVSVCAWDSIVDGPGKVPWPVVDADIAAILYTSGSTGKPKGVVLSQRNMVSGAESVAQYLENRESDRLLAALPFSFDYGFSQLSTAFLTGASVALMDYLLPRDIITALQRYAITGLAAVPPFWIQLAALSWPTEIAVTLRYITNSGGTMPTATLTKLREKLPSTAVYLMYGLTEAFRSTYLPPDQVDVRPTSIGKAIPNAEVMVVRPDGTPCDPGEPGELVHRGALVSLGYWNDKAQTAERFRPAPGQPAALPLPELAVWSGDTVVKDEEGYLYFVGRRDEMIKTSGYRVSPTEVEEVLYASGLIAEAVVVGAPHPVVGKAIVAVAVAVRPETDLTERLLAACRTALPSYMVPQHVAWRKSLPRNANGKIDRPAVAATIAELFAEGING